MYFPKVLIAAFAARALGEKAPSLPQLAAVTDAIAPAVADDAPVLRGQSAYPKASAVASEGGEDAATVSEAAAALEEAINLASDKVVAAETAGTPAGLRGAAGDEIQQLEVWKYEKVNMKASVQRSVVSRLTPGSGDSWDSTTVYKEQQRTTRKQLYEETNRWNVDVSSTVATSMTMGASFPIEVIGFSAEASASFSLTVQVGIESSSTVINNYEKETITELTHETQTHYAANPAGGEVKVVFEEKWKLGNTVFRIVYLNCDEAESEKAEWAYEEKDVTMSVGVDHQWYHIKNGIGHYLQAGDPNNGLQSQFLVVKALVSYSYDQQWTLDRHHLMSRSNRYATRVCDDGGLQMWSSAIEADQNNYYSWTGTQIKDGYGYCLGLHVQYPYEGGYYFDVESEECGGDSGGDSAWKQWSFIPV